MNADYQFPFERLDVWQDARRLAVKIYRETAHFPDEEKLGLVSQVRRASVSVPSNLAEGSARISLKEQARFSEISYSSLMESMCQLILSNDLDFLTNDSLQRLRSDVHRLSNGINALRASQLRRAAQ